MVEFDYVKQFVHAALAELRNLQQGMKGAASVLSTTQWEIAQ